MEITKAGKSYKIREGTIDDFVVHEGCYNKLNFDKEDIWFDIGGNIGAFCVQYSDKVKQMISFEPEIDNYELLVHNLELNNIQNVIAYNYAVVGNEDKSREFYVYDGKNKGKHSLIPNSRSTKISISCTNINTMLDKYKPNKLKVDTEGAEIEILYAIKDFSNITEIIMEYHFMQLKDKSKSIYFDLLSFMKTKGLIPTSIIDADAKYQPTCIIHFKRNIV